MATRKLTASQIAVLREAKAGTLYRSESIGSLYDSFNGGHKKVNRQVDVLKSVQPPLIRIGERNRFQRPWHITDEGERVLARHDEARKDG